MILDVFPSGPVLQSPLTVFTSSQCSKSSLIPSSNQNNWPVLVNIWIILAPKSICFIALDMFLLESGRSSFRLESSQKELQPKQMFELKFEVMANARGQIEAHLKNMTPKFYDQE